MVAITNLNSEAMIKTKDLSRWAASPRYDLSSIPLMHREGWKVKFSEADKRSKRTSPDNVPRDDVSFEKGNMRAWQYKGGWMYAELIDERFANHKPHEDLTSILKTIETKVV